MDPHQMQHAAPRSADQPIMSRVLGMTSLLRSTSQAPFITLVVVALSAAILLMKNMDNNDNKNISPQRLIDWPTVGYERVKGKKQIHIVEKFFIAQTTC